MKQFFLLGLLVTCTVVSCKKDDNGNATLPAMDVKPVSNSFSATNGYMLSATGSNADKVVGLKFTVARNGRITKLGCNLPAASNYEIKLWDVSGANPTVIASQIVQQLNNASYVERGITPVQVVPNKAYVVSVFAGGNQIFTATKGGSSNVFPVTSGNITFISAQSLLSGNGVNASNATYPSESGQTGALGLTDFEFVAD
jgi:hypothetical protein